MRIDADAGKGEFAHIGAADGDHAGLFQQVDDGGIGLCRRVLFQDRRAGGRDHAFQRKEILPGDRNAVENAQRPAVAVTGGRGFGLLHGTLLRQRDEDGFVRMAFDGVEDLFGNLDRCGFTELEEGGEAGDRHRSEIP